MADRGRNWNEARRSVRRVVRVIFGTLDDHVPAVVAVAAPIGDNCSVAPALVRFVGDDAARPTAVDADDLLGRLHAGNANDQLA